MRTNNFGIKSLCFSTVLLVLATAASARGDDLSSAGVTRITDSRSSSTFVGPSGSNIVAGFQSFKLSPVSSLPTLPPLPSAKGRTSMPVLNVENNAHRFYDPGMTPAGSNFERVETYGRPVPPETQSRNLLQQFGNGLKNIFKPASRRRLPHHVSAPEWNGSFSETGVQPLAQYKRIPLSGKTALYGGYRGDCVKSCGDSCGKSCEKSCGTSNGNSNGTCDGACGSTCGNCDGEPEGRSCVKHFEKCHDHLRKCLECKFGYFCHQGCCGKGCPHYGSYEMLYSAKPDYFDPRDGRLYSAQGFGMPVAVPLAPNVTNQYNYGWGIPSSRLTPISTIIPQLP